MDLKDRIVVVTGGGSGICLEFVKQASSAGAKVILGDLRLTEEAQAWLPTSRNVVFKECDVVNWKHLQGLVDAAVQEFGDVPDVYVPGAGVFEPSFSNFWDDPEDDGYAMLDINIAHPAKLNRIAIRELVKAKKTGVVLHISSIGGYNPNLGACLYVASKHAIIGLTRSLADLEYMYGIRVMAMCPGIVKTRLWTDRGAEKDRTGWGYDDATAISPEHIAKNMIEMITDASFKGGDCLEVLTEESSRLVPLYRAEPPALLKRVLDAEKADPALHRRTVDESWGWVRDKIDEVGKVKS